MSDTLPTTDDVLEGVDLSGRIAVVTGATGGLGLETARALAAAGARVVLAGRGHDRLQAAAGTIAEQHPAAALESVELDLASLASVRAAADEIADRHERLDLLIANAGVMFTPFGRTEDGFEQQVGINHLGHFALAVRLLPRLRAADAARVIVVSSHGHHLDGVHLDDLNYEQRVYDKFAAYGQAKTANALFARELDRREHDITALSLHPGMIATDLARYMDRADFEEMTRRAPGASSGELALRTIPQGAATTVYAATAPELAAHGGAYLADCEVSERVAAHATDDELARRLWERSAELVGVDAD